MKILLLGKNGQVGWQLQRALAPLGEVIAWGRESCDMADTAGLAARVQALAPQIIVNATAYTAVDKAESEPELAYAINAEAPRQLALAARNCGAKLVHYSTDYVFSGTKTSAYDEDDTPAPRSVYGQSKRAGEEAIQGVAGAQSVIFRTSWVFGEHGGNFVKTILRLAAEREALNVVDDQIGAPTPAALIADVTALALRQWQQESGNIPAHRLYHLSAAQPVSWYTFACEIVRLAKMQGRTLRLEASAIKPIPSADYPTPAARPANSRLNCQRLEADFSLQLPAWQGYLERLLPLLPGA
ncbi:dTDP-4-dehydrorhamnose reductase [Azonexus sp.]|uniref:dTDP-4-dehydrorhamnose reductase n=1 Tax=Azonexus sp. TaxID=1872668 RepID=UPI0039E72553